MSNANTKPTTEIAQPRPSASLVIVNRRNEILLVHRNVHARSFAGFHVFPGGNFDEKQDDMLEMTAIRETFEESGLLLASSSDPSSPLDDATLNEARRAIHAQKMAFSTFLTEHNLKADLSTLLPFTQWVTPPTAPRRFRTQFFVAFLPDIQSSGFSTGNKEERIPTPDGGQEVISARFIHPQSAITEFRQGSITIMPPQYYILSTLAGVLQTRENTAAQREQVGILSRGSFGRMVFNPLMMRERDEEGRNVLTLEGDETRGGPKGRLHRTLIRFGKGGVVTEIVVLRNFDIFSEVEPSVQTKL